MLAAWLRILAFVFNPVSYQEITEIKVARKPALNFGNFNNKSEA